MSSSYRQSYAARNDFVPSHSNLPPSPDFYGYTNDAQRARYSGETSTWPSISGVPVIGTTSDFITPHGSYLPVDPFGRLRTHKAPNGHRHTGSGSLLSNTSVEPMTPTHHSTIPFSSMSPTAVGSSFHASRFSRNSRPRNQHHEPTLNTMVGKELPYPTTTPTNVGCRTSRMRTAVLFLLDTLPRYLYLNVLLYLPALYYNRITSAFTDAGLSLSDVEEMSWLYEETLNEDIYLRFEDLRDRCPMNLMRFKGLWKDLIQDMVFEWQLQGILAVLLQSAIFTLLQIDEFREDSVSRTSALLSLVAALVSLLHSCVFVVRFRKSGASYQAATLAGEARNPEHSVIWNAWVCLALPATWLAWALIAFMATLLSYVWRTGAGENYGPLTKQRAIGIRVSISVVLALGLVCFGLTLQTLARCGSTAGLKQQSDTGRWSHPSSPLHAHPPITGPPLSPTSSSYSTEQVYPAADPPSIQPQPLQSGDLPGLSPSLGQSRNCVPGPYETFLLVSANLDDGRDVTTTPFLLSSPPVSADAPESITRQSSKQSIFRFSLPDSPTIALTDKGIQASEWDLFSSHLERAWKGALPIPNVPPDKLVSLRQIIIQDILRTWNSRYFASRGLEVAIVEPNKASTSTCIVVYDTKGIPNLMPGNIGHTPAPPSSLDATPRMKSLRQPPSIRTVSISEPSSRLSWPTAPLVGQRQYRSVYQLRTPQPTPGPRLSSPSTLPAVHFRNTTYR